MGDLVATCPLACISRYIGSICLCLCVYYYAPLVRKAARVRRPFCWERRQELVIWTYEGGVIVPRNTYARRDASRDASM